ncbi:MAG: sulfatase-like hydrolase/transferase [Chloroflexota bacterium]
MPKQLWFRLLLGSSFILVVALVTAGFVLHLSTTSSFEDYVDDVSAARSQRIEALLSRYFSRRQDWTGVEPLVAQISDLVGQPVILANSLDVVIMDTQNQLTGQRVRDTWRHQVVPIRASDVAVGTLYIDPLHAPNKFGARGDAFLSELSTSLLTALGVGLLTALAISLLVARRLAMPLETLTVAVRKLEAGERTTQIDASMAGEVGALADAFNSLVSSLARVEQLRSNMVNDIAHELRTPLTTLRGYVEAFRDGVADPTPEVLETLHGELLQLTRLVDDLRDIALAEAGQLHLAPEFSSVEALVNHDVRALAVTAAVHQLRIETRISADIPNIWVDAGRFSQVLRNLLNNAIAHTPAGGIVSLTAEYDGEDVSIHIQDSGTGIPSEDLPHIFERFYRGDRSRSRRAGGAGLGLTIAREIVVAHHGLLSVESPPNQGARFTIRLPVRPAVAPGATEHPSVSGQQRVSPWTRAWNVLRLTFYGFMCGGLAGMVGGVAESLMVAAVARHSLDTMGLVSYAIVIDSTVIGGICAILALAIGTVSAGLGHSLRFRALAPTIGPTAILAVGAILALKWAQISSRDASIPNAVGGQLLIVGSTLLVAVVAFAALSSTPHWPNRPVHLSRRMLPLVTMTIGVLAVLGIMRDLADRGYPAPLAVVQAVREVTIGQASSPGSVRSDAAAAVANNLLAGARPNVLLVSIDALRADHVGAYGYHAARTPALDSIAEQGWKSELAITPKTSSSAAHASIMTGTQPSRHGINTDLLDTLARDVPTLAEILKANGYTTAGLYSWFNFEPSYSGLDRGFQTYEDYTVNLPRYLADAQTQALAATYRRLKSYLALPGAADLDLTLLDPGDSKLDGKADITAAAASRWLERRRSDPFFLWVHFRDPHAPYSSPLSLAADSDCNVCHEESVETLQRIRDGDVDLSAPEINRVISAYDDEVGFVDRQIGSLLRQLDLLGLDSNTVVIVVGAYGQSLGDHGAWLEGSSVYNSEIHVPLLIRYPGVLAPSQVITEPSSVMDVAPTILQLAGIMAPEGMEGLSLVAALGNSRAPVRSVVSESADTGAVALITGEWKLIHAPGGQVELYNLSADPDELLDRRESEPQIVRHLTERLSQITGGQSRGIRAGG